MATQQDLVRLLTGISGTQQPVQPTPVAGSKNFAGMFGAQQAAKLSGGIQNLARGGAPSPQQNIASAISNIDLKSADGLRTMAKVKQIQGDIEGANALNQQAVAMEKLRLDELKEEEAQTGFLQFIATNHPQYTGLVESGVLKAENWTAFIKDKSQGSGMGFGGADKYVDTKGNLYYGAMTKDPDGGSISSQITPLAGSPAQPVGKLQLVSTGVYGGMTQEAAAKARKEAIQNKENAKTEGDEKREQNKIFAAKQGAAIDEFSLSSEAVRNADDMLLILDQINTGGIQATGTKALTDTFNMTDANVAEFDVMAKQMMVAKLEAFGSNPSDGERKAAAELVPAILSSGTLNKRLITRFKNEMARRARNRQYLLRPEATRDGYRAFSLAQYESLMTTPKTWADLQEVAE